jgi:polyphenol oxidase
MSHIAFSEILNRGRFETWTQKPEMQLIDIKQVHGVDIVSKQTLPCEADGLISSWENFDKPLAIKTADCLPILIEGEEGVVFIHAGWKGLAHGILKRPEISVINPKNVFIGPSIQVCCFEVSPDFRENFPHSHNFEERSHKYFFNLQLEAKNELCHNFPGLLVETSSVCTCCNLNFHSYRRNQTTERNWNIYIKG